MIQAPVAVLADNSNPERSRDLATQLALPLITVPPSEETLLLFYSNNNLACRLAGKAAPGPVYVDFTAGALDYRRQHGGGELIVKACGGAPRSSRTVLDATAGLGRDSFTLACHGFNVTMIERHPVVHALLADGLQRGLIVAEGDLLSALGRMRLRPGDAIDLLSVGSEFAPDIIYLDPMFPLAKKSALVKKEMQAFHQLVGQNEDEAQLLAASLSIAVYRVVVKRPLKAAFLADHKPSYSLTGKAIRFDIYARKALSDKVLPNKALPNKQGSTIHPDF